MEHGQRQTNSREAWPEFLDALTAAASHHRVLLENEQVRVLDSWIAPRDTVPLHTHRWPGVIHVLSASDFVRCDAEGRVLLDSRTLPSRPQRGDVLWSPPLEPHSLHNVGNAELRVITVEIKHASPADVGKWRCYRRRPALLRPERKVPRECRETTRISGLTALATDRVSQRVGPPARVRCPRPCGIASVRSLDGTRSDATLGASLSQPCWKYPPVLAEVYARTDRACRACVDAGYRAA